MDKIIFATINENGQLFYLVSKEESLEQNLNVFENPTITKTKVFETEHPSEFFRREVKAIFDNQLNAVAHGFYGETLSAQRIEKFFELAETYKNLEPAQ